jgi:hypothetical protein
MLTARNQLALVQHFKQNSIDVFNSQDYIRSQYIDCHKKQAFFTIQNY